MKKSIFSNITANAQKLYRGAKGLIVEDGVISKSFDDAINNHSKVRKNIYNNSSKAYGEEITEKMSSYKKDILEQAGDVKFAGVKLSSEQSSKINSAVADELAYEFIGARSGKGIHKAYKSKLMKTKVLVAGNTAKGVLDNYYVSPLKSGVKSIKSTKFKDNKNLHKAMGRIGATGVAVGGFVGASNLLSSDKKYE